jgi:hypothetical protein
MQQINHDRMIEATYQLIVDVPVEHLNPLELNPSWDLFYLFLVLKMNPCCLNFFVLLF